MNGRVAKALRRIAEEGSVGLPKKAYGHVMRGKSPTATIALDKSTRKAYKALKAAYKAGGFRGVGRTGFAGRVQEEVQD